MLPGQVFDSRFREVVRAFGGILGLLVGILGFLGVVLEFLGGF